MAQTRIVLKPEDRPLIEELRQTTGAGSASEAITLLIRRYAPHFIEWFKSNPHQCKYSGAIGEATAEKNTTFLSSPIAPTPEALLPVEDGKLPPFPL